MHIRTKLLAAVATSALLASGAQAAPAKKHHAAASSNANRELLDEVRALREQVNEMKQRLDVQESAQVNTQETATAAQTQAAAAVTQAQAAQTQAAVAAQAVPTEVKTALAANKPKPQWFDSTTISGRMYFNFSDMTQKLNGVKPAGGTSGNGTGFNIKRMYIGVDHTFSPIFSANVTMDISNVVGSTSNYNFNANSTASPANSTALVGRGFYVKKAYLQAKLNPALIIRAGSADMPWIPFIENQYGYRHIENTFIDRVGYGTSADWGIHVLGDLAGGLISYQFSAVDGGTYRTVKVTKSVDFEGRVSASYKGFFAGVDGYSGKRGNDTQGVDATLPLGLDHVRNATRINAAAGYKTKLFTVGGEYLHAKNWNNTTTLAEDKSDGFAVFGNVNFAKQWSVFGRYDRFKPSKELNPNLKDDYFNAGIQWEPVKIVDIALVYKHEKINNIDGIASYAYSYQNAPGLTIAKGSEATTSEIGLFGQLRF